MSSPDFRTHATFSMMRVFYSSLLVSLLFSKVLSSLLGVPEWEEDPVLSVVIPLAILSFLCFFSGASGCSKSLSGSMSSKYSLSFWSLYIEVNLPSSLRYLFSKVLSILTAMISYSFLKPVLTSLAINLNSTAASITPLNASLRFIFIRPMFIGFILKDCPCPY